MKNFLRAFGVLAVICTAVPATAGVRVEVGVPSLVLGEDPCAMPTGELPYYCAYPVYSEPVWIGGVEYRRPLRFRTIGSHREFIVNGRWRAEDRDHPRR